MTVPRDSKQSPKIFITAAVLMSIKNLCFEQILENKKKIHLIFVMFTAAKLTVIANQNNHLLLGGGGIAAEEIRCVSDDI